MNEDRLWLTPEKEAVPYSSNSEYYSSKLEIIKINKQIVDKMFSNDPLTAQESERCATIRASIGAVLLEDEIGREAMPPYKDEFNRGHKEIIQGYNDAQEFLFSRLDAKDWFGRYKDRFLDHNILPYLYQMLVKDNEDMARKDKIGFRDGNNIQLSFCQPTDASQITTEVAQMFVEFVNCDVNWADPDADRPINFENIAKAHAQFVRIQPFTDANKRMAFILTNGMLKLQGLSPISICETKEESEKYMTALKKAIVERDVTDLAEYFVDCEIAAQRNIINEATISAVENEILGPAKKHSIDDPDAPGI